MSNPALHVIVPARDEADSVAAVVTSLLRVLPGARVVVVDDGSRDETGSVARRAGAEVLRLPLRLGVGAAVQSGVLLAVRRGAQRCVRVDADGQHRADDVPRLIEALDGGADLVIGSRFLTAGGDRSTHLRRLGIRWLSALVRLRGGGRVSDPTSGFRAYSRRAMEWVARYHPEDSPEPQVLAPMVRGGFTVREVAVDMSPRVAGTTKFGGPWSAVYVMKVSVAILLGSVR